MAKVFTVYRIVKGQTGSAISHPVKVFDDEKLAAQGLDAAAGPLAAIIESGKVLVGTPQGPRMVMTVQQLLVELGVEGISYGVVPQEVHGAIIVAPTAAIIQ